MTRGRVRKSEEDAWSKLSALEPAGPVERRRIPKIEIQRERKAISKPVHGLKYSDHQETQGHFLQVKADAEIDSDDSLWATNWLATLERDNVLEGVVQRKRRWKRQILQDVSQRVGDGDTIQNREDNAVTAAQEQRDSPYASVQDFN